MARIITHNGPFHADDAVAVATLKLRYGSAGFTVIRSRDPKVIQGGDIVVDVGGRLGTAPGADGEMASFFDHHQKGGAGARGNGVPFAAAGLVWSAYGHDLIKLMYPALNEAEVSKLHTLVDRDFLTGVDAADCGYDLTTGWKGDARPLTFSAVVSALNPSWFEEQNFDASFDKAVDYAITALRAAIKAAYGTVLAAGHVQSALDARTDTRILVLPKFCPWGDVVFGSTDANDVLYVVFPTSTGDQWNVQCVPDAPGGFGKRKALPAAWGGLKPDELRQMTGVLDMVFCHPGLFICGASSRDGALHLAELACAAE